MLELAFVYVFATETTDPWALVGQVGSIGVISAVFAWLWRDERTQRQAAEGRERELLATSKEDRDKVAGMLTATAQALGEIRGALGRTVERTQQVDPDRLARLVADLEEQLSAGRLERGDRP